MLDEASPAATEADPVALDDEVKVRVGKKSETESEEDCALTESPPRADDEDPAALLDESSDEAVLVAEDEDPVALLEDASDEAVVVVEVAAPAPAPAPFALVELEVRAGIDEEELSATIIMAIGVTATYMVGSDASSAANPSGVAIRMRFDTRSTTNMAATGPDASMNSHPKTIAVTEQTMPVIPAARFCGAVAIGTKSISLVSSPLAASTLPEATSTS